MYLQINDVRKQYGDKIILNNINLAVDIGEFCTVIGPSGCGKSTLLRLILGQESVTSGQIIIDGQEDGYADSRRGIVYQKYSLYNHLKVIDNVCLGLRYQTPNSRKHKKEIYEKGMEYLQRVKLEDAANKYPHELSGGMQQRVAIVQATITHPKILLMDEPFAALDPRSRDKLQLFTLELQKEFGITIFFVTHDVTEALFLGSRLLLLSHFDENKVEHGDGSRIVSDMKLDKDTLLRGSPSFMELREKIITTWFN